MALLPVVCMLWLAAVVALPAGTARPPSHESLFGPAPESRLHGFLAIPSHDRVEQIGIYTEVARLPDLASLASRKYPFARVLVPDPNIFRSVIPGQAVPVGNKLSDLFAPYDIVAVLDRTGLVSIFGRIHTVDKHDPTAEQQLAHLQNLGLPAVDPQTEPGSMFVGGTSMTELKLDPEALINSIVSAGTADPGDRAKKSVGETSVDAP